MFIFSIMIGIIIGLIAKGSFKNLINVSFKGIYLVAISFGIEITMKLLIRMDIIDVGTTTFIFDIFMYLVLLIFVLMNRKDKYIIIIGVGFLLNAVAIFSNGGAMPVSQQAMDAITKNIDPSSIGLYSVMNTDTNFWYLCDLIYLKFIGPFVFSIGDIVSGIGIIFMLIAGMKGKYNQNL